MKLNVIKDGSENEAEALLLDLLLRGLVSVLHNCDDGFVEGGLVVVQDLGRALNVREERVLVLCCDTLARGHNCRLVRLGPQVQLGPDQDDGHRWCRGPQLWDPLRRLRKRAYLLVYVLVRVSVVHCVAEEDHVCLRVA